MGTGMPMTRVKFQFRYIVGCKYTYLPSRHEGLATQSPATLILILIPHPNPSSRPLSELRRPRTQSLSRAHYCGCFARSIIDGGHNDPQDPDSTFPVMDVYLVADVNETISGGHRIWSSGVLRNYEYDACPNRNISCYSPVVNVDATGFEVPHAQGQPMFVRFQFQNNKRNVQIPINKEVGMQVVVSACRPLPPSPQMRIVFACSCAVCPSVVLIAAAGRL